MQSCLTIGYGDLPPEQLHERMLMCVYMLIGVVVFAYLVGEFSGDLEERFMGVSERDKALERCRAI